MSDTREHSFAKSFICCSSFIWAQILVGLGFLETSDFLASSTLYFACGAIIFGTAFAFHKALSSLKIIRSDLYGLLAIICFTLMPNALILGLISYGWANPMEAFLITIILSICAGAMYFKFLDSSPLKIETI